MNRLNGRYTYVIRIKVVDELVPCVHIKRMICCLVELKGRSRLMSGWYMRSIFDNSVKVEVSNH